MSGKTSRAPVSELRAFDEHIQGRGFSCPAGIDEAGRGPLAGPVVAAAVILPAGVELSGVHDSKKLSPAQRDSCYREIYAAARAVGVGCIENGAIDRINILQATFQAMLLAVENLQITPDLLLIDGPYSLPVAITQQGVRGGDRRSLSIAAASIVAKVHRDRLMMNYHRLYPAYGFDMHKGYPTREHLAQLRRHGPCPIHRLSFRGVVAASAKRRERCAESIPERPAE